jgi:hypothetical protein
VFCERNNIAENNDRQPRMLLQLKFGQVNLDILWNLEYVSFRACHLSQNESILKLQRIWIGSDKLVQQISTRNSGLVHNL